METSILSHPFHELCTFYLGTMKVLSLFLLLHTSPLSLPPPTIRSRCVDHQELAQKHQNFGKKHKRSI